MSVRRPERDISEAQFLTTARELELFTLRRCTKFPKRYTFYIGQEIANSAKYIYRNVKRGNSVFPIKTQQDVIMRRNCFLNAHMELQNLVSQIEIANELFGIDKEVMRQWMELVDLEIRLINGLLKKEQPSHPDNFKG